VHIKRRILVGALALLGFATSIEAQDHEAEETFVQFMDRTPASMLDIATIRLTQHMDAMRMRLQSEGFDDLPGIVLLEDDRSKIVLHFRNGMVYPLSDAETLCRTAFQYMRDQVIVFSLLNRQTGLSFAVAPGSALPEERRRDLDQSIEMRVHVDIERGDNSFLQLACTSSLYHPSYDQICRAGEPKDDGCVPYDFSDFELFRRDVDMNVRDVRSLIKRD
jgi:hypothetical protein